MALSRPLAIAVAAMILLVGSVTFEIVFHRSFSVEVHDAAGWHTIGTAGTEPSRPAALHAPVTVVADRNATLDFQLRTDNGYPWSYADHYAVIYNGAVVAEGDIAAGARGVHESPFSLPAATLFSGLGPSAEPIKGTPGTNITFPSFDVQVGNVDVYASFQLQEASS